MFRKLSKKEIENRTRLFSIKPLYGSMRVINLTRRLEMTVKIPLIEKDCTIVFKGREFESGGAVVTEKDVIAYHKIKDGKHTITTWHGDLVSDKVLILSERKGYFYDGTVHYYLRFKIGDIVYSGYSHGNGVLVRARATKSKSIFQ